MNLAVAIDYTASNGEIDDPDCLHFMGPQNQYEAAINMVGGIVEPYDYDKQFPLYGFGGINTFSGGAKVNHCFPLNGNAQSPLVAGVAGILSTYRSTLPHIKFSGPTYFAPVLEAFLEHCKRQFGKTNYNVLLILTDGTIHDMAKTKSLLVDLSVMPCSVIIIGLGDAEFDNMHELDGDAPNRLTDDSGRQAVRDIVQFVEFIPAASKGDIGEQVM